MSKPWKRTITNSLFFFKNHHIIKNPVKSDKLVTTSKSDPTPTRSAPLAEIKGKQSNNDFLNNQKEEIHVTKEIGESVVSNANSTIIYSY